MANLTTYVNVSATDSPFGTSGIDFVEFSSGNDQLIFTGGSTEVQDGADIPTGAELISAGIEVTGSQIIVSTYLLADISDNLLKSIDLMGNLDSQYVLAFDFDAATASEPVLEIWDDSNLTTVTSTFLGSGTPSSSFVRGITTTTSSSGSGWATTTGIKMAGSSSGNFLFLNDQNGALTAATTLYANLAVVIPASQTIGFSANPVFAVKFLSN